MNIWLIAVLTILSSMPVMAQNGFTTRADDPTVATPTDSDTTSPTSGVVTDIDATSDNSGSLENRRSPSAFGPSVGNHNSFGNTPDRGGANTGSAGRIDNLGGNTRTPSPAAATDGGSNLGTVPSGSRTGAGSGTAGGNAGSGSGAAGR
jgi:hypothetical protein